MEGHRVKSLSLDPRSRNRFRFASQRQREQRATADVYRGYKRRIGVASSADREEAVHHTKEPSAKKSRSAESDTAATPASTTLSLAAITDLQSASLAEELDLASDRNGSEIFGKFYRQIWYHVRSLPEILHHREKIVQLMLEYLLTAMEGSSYEQGRVRFVPNPATTDILHLLAVLARDLRHEIHPYVHTRILPRLVDDLLNPPMAKKQTVPLDVTIVEACLRTLSYLFRYDAERLVSETAKEGEPPCLEPMRQYYGKTLAHRREVVRRLSAEALAPLIRRLPNDGARKKHLKRVFRAMSAVASTDQAVQRAQDNAIGGIARLCLQLVQGVSGRLHSKADALIKVIFECSCTQYEGKASNQAMQKIGKQFLTELCSYLKTPVACTIYEHVVKMLGKQLNEKKDSVSLMSILKLATQLASFEDGVLAQSSSTTKFVLSMLQQLLEPTQFGDLSATIRAEAMDFLCQVWKANPLDEVFTESVAQMLETSIPTFLNDEGGKDFFLRLLNDDILPLLPRKLSLGTLGSVLLKVAARLEKPEFTFSIILSLATACNVDNDPAKETDTVVFLDNASDCCVTKDTWEALLEQCLVDFSSLEITTDLGLIASTIQSAVFVGMLSCNTWGNKKGNLAGFKQITEWLRRAITFVSKTSERDSFHGNEDDVSVCTSVAVDGLACYIRATKAEVGCASSIMKEEVASFQNVVAHHLEKHPNSMWAVKSCAAFAIQLKDITGKFLIDDANKVFDLLVPNLAEPSHFLRLHTLEILLIFPDKPFLSDHADLDLTDDLDEEPSETANPRGEQKSRFSGMCRLLHTLMDLEQTTADLQNERKLVSYISSVEVQGRSAKMPVPYVEAAVAHMLGLLYVRFSPIWEPAQAAIVGLIQGCDKYAWPFLQRNLSVLMFQAPVQLPPADDAPLYDGSLLLKNYVHWDRTQGLAVSLFRATMASAEDDGRVSRHLSRSVNDVALSIWGVLEKRPQLVVLHSREIVGVILRFLALHFFRQHDPDAIEIGIRSYVPENDSSGDTFVPGRKAVENRMQAILKVCAKVNGPQQMHKHKALLQAYVSVLGYSDSLAQYAFSSLLRFKLAYVLPHAETISKFFARGKLREALLELKELKNNGSITKEHRQKLVPLITRILLGRVASKNTSRSAKDSPAARRVAIFSFLAGFCEGSEELYPAIYLSVRQFIQLNNLKEIESQTAEDRQQLSEKMKDIGQRECGRLPSKVHEGYLNMLEAIISQLGHHVVQFVPTFFSIILGIMEIYQVVDGSDNDVQEEAQTEEEAIDHQTSRSGRIRALCFRRLSELLDRYAGVHDFSGEFERMWNCVGPSLKGVPESAASSDKSPSAMVFLRTISSHASILASLRVCKEATEAMINSLGKAASTSVADTSLSFVENLLGLDKSGEKSNGDGDGADLIQKHMGLLLQNFKYRLSRPERSTTFRREIRVLCGVSELMTNDDDIARYGAKTVDALTELLLPYLGPGSRLSEQDKSNIISVLHTLLPGLSVETATGLFRTLSQSLGPTKFGAVTLTSRYAIADTLHRTATIHFPEAVATSQVVVGLCALNTKRVGELDYDSSISMLQRLSKGGDELSWDCLSTETTEWLTPIVQTCFQFLQDEDGVLARTSLKALRSLVDLASSTDISSEESISWERFLESKILPATRSGIQAREESTRRLYVQLLSTVVDKCRNSKSDHLHGDLALLIRRDNPDLDFFEGICHVQVHRRAKALTRLRRILDDETKSDCRFSLLSLSNILLTLSLHPIYETKSKNDDAFALEAMATVGSIARLISWSKYNNLIGTLLNQFQRHANQEKYLVGTICSVLDNMDFEFLSSENSEMDSTVIRALERRIIPKTEELLTKEVKRGGATEKTIRPSIVLALLKLAQKLPRDLFHMKLHRLLSVICDALKNRDSSIREIARSTLAKMSVSIDLGFLADVVRELTISLKEGYQLHVRAASVHSILLELADNVGDDVGKLENVSERTAFDSTVPAFVDLIQEDIFGAAQERKDAGDSQVRFVKEAGGSKSLHSLELISSMVSFDPPTNSSSKDRSAVHAVVAPFLERLKSDENSKLTRRARNCLERIVQGLAKNKTLTAEKAFGFAYATVSHYIQQTENVETTGDDNDAEVKMDESLQVSTSSVPRSRPTSEGTERVKGSMSMWHPSALGMAKSDREAVDMRRLDSNKLRRVEDGSRAPKLTGSSRRVVVAGTDSSWNSPAHTSAIIFGLQVLQIALRRDLRDTKLLDPFVPLLADCVCKSGDPDILRLSMKSLGTMLSSEVSSIKLYAGKLAEKTVDLLASSGGNEEIQHSCFKLLTFLLKSGKETNVHHDDSVTAAYEANLLSDQARMDTLLSFVRQSILESEQHSQAVMLLKSIISSKYSSSELYDLMEVVLEQSVRSPKESLRQQGSGVYLSFLLNYPMTEERFEQELKQVLLNIGYEYSDGRVSALNLVNLIVTRLPSELLEKKGQMFFLPLTMQLANDTSDDCRREVATCIKSLLGRASVEVRQSLFEYTARWTGSSDRLLRRTALQIYGLFLEASPEFCLRKEISLELVSTTTIVLSRTGDSDWETLYFALSATEKLSTSSGMEPLDGTRDSLSSTVLDSLIHEHAWVQLVSTRLLWTHLKKLDPTSFADKKKNRTFLSKRGVLFDIGRNLCAILARLEEESGSNNQEELVKTVIKSLTWTLTAMDKFPYLCLDGNMEPGEKSPTRWVLKRLSGIAKARSRARRQSVFKCYASFIISGPQNAIKDNLNCMIEPLHRVELESNNDTISSQWQRRDNEAVTLSPEVELAQEVLQMLESKFDTHFLEALAAVRKKAKATKEERKRLEKVEAARDPKLAAEQKIRKQAREKNRRKRRVEERRKDRGAIAKRRHLSSEA